MVAVSRNAKKKEKDKKNEKQTLTSERVSLTIYNTLIVSVFAGVKFLFWSFTMHITEIGPESPQATVKRTFQNNNLLLYTLLFFKCFMYKS